MEEYLLPDHDTSGRPYSTDHRLGRVMKLRGHDDAYHLAAEANISPRQLSRYLAGEKIPMHHLASLSAELECPGEYLQEVENGGAADPT